jgi:hypothetical protein
MTSGTDELYTRMFSLKAPINRDDVSVIYLKYKPGDEVVTYKLPVIVSGSQMNDRVIMYALMSITTL